MTWMKESIEQKIGSSYTDSKKLSKGVSQGQVWVSDYLTVLSVNLFFIRRDK